jgi:hypothetical protein
MFGFIGWLFNAFFYLSPLFVLPMALSISFYLMLRISFAYVMFHLIVLGLKKLVPTLFVNLVSASFRFDSMVSVRVANRLAREFSRT